MGIGLLEAKATTAAPPTAEQEVFLRKLARLRRSHPENLCARYMNRDLFLSFDERAREVLYRCCRSGAENADSLIGCYLMNPGDLHDFAAFFEPLIRDYHRASEARKRVGDREGDPIDVAALGLPNVSMRVRVARNVNGFRLTGNMDRGERVRFEKAAVQALQRFIDHPDFGGRVYSLTPEFGPGEANPNPMTSNEHRELVNAGLMFRNPEADPYLVSAGITGDWPYGRACYVSADREIAVWVGEEDHLRILCMRRGTDLTECFDKLRRALGIFEAMPGISFIHDERFGYINSCPSNLGTGMRASVHVAMRDLSPRLAKPGVSIKAICECFGLFVRGTAGERAAIGTDGMLHLSPGRRLFFSEREILAVLFQGLRGLAQLV